MNAQQQDILRLLSNRGPMTSRELFDVMQDELGYYSQASTHDQRQAAVESLSKILSKLKAEGIIDGEMTPQEKGRPFMRWSAIKSGQKPISETAMTLHPPSQLGINHVPYTDDHAEMTSYVVELAQTHTDAVSNECKFTIEHAMIVVKSGTRIPQRLAHITPEFGGTVKIDGVVYIKTRDELAQFIGAIERMLP